MGAVREQELNLGALNPILELAQARDIISPISGGTHIEDTLTIEQLAGLADSTTESVRVAQYNTRESAF